MIPRATPAMLVFRPRVVIWLFMGLLTLVIAGASLLLFLDPTTWWLEVISGLLIACWVAFLIGLARARLELRESTIEIHSPPYKALPKRARTWLFWVLVLLVVGDLGVLFTDTTPRALREFHFALRIIWLGAYLAAFLTVFESGRHSLKYSEITTLPWEEKLGPLPSAKSLYVGMASSTEPFQFPPWLAEVDRREVAGRLTARVKHAHALEAQGAGAHHAAGPSPHYPSV